MSLVCGRCTVCCGFFVGPLGFIGRLSSVFVTLLGHLPHFLSQIIHGQPTTKRER